jgi:hypothetical protein
MTLTVLACQLRAGRQPTKAGAAVAALFALLAVPGVAQETAPQPPRSFVRASSEATVRVPPDQVRIQIGVTTQAQTAQAAAAQNAAQLDSAIKEMRKALGSAAELKTVGYSVHADYRYPQGGGQPKIAGYSATNMIDVTLNDVLMAGKAIDLATQSGVNTVNSVQFSLKDESASQAQALREATAKARVKAEAMAQALGVKVVRVVSAEEGGTNIIRPFSAMQAEARAAAAPTTPVESGEIEVRASVTVTLEVSP